MADLAMAFRWTPSDMDPMSPEELMRWWEKAHARMNQDEDDG